MKGVNAIENTNDPGKDGETGVNNSFAKDLTAFSLEYFNNDYQAINNETPFATVNAASHAASNSSALYNGNIRYMQTRLTNPTTGEAMPMLNAYQYDQLNRLLESRSYENSLSSNEWNPITYGSEYLNRFSYDEMGNILHQDRHLRDGTKIENMTYQYQYEDPTNQQRLMRNRLYHINDDIASSVNTGDIDDMGTFDSDIENINVNNNYAYDEEGRLVKDVQEGIQKIEWTVSGKVKKVIRVSESEKKYLTFDYDAMGHRIAKHVYDNETNMLEKSTYYILDAQGNQMSMYEHVPLETTVEYNLVERNIYGSSRTGTFTEKINVLTATYQYSNISQSSGLKFYEFTNHLGNVLSVFSDSKIPLDGDSDGTVDGYSIQIVSVADYSPFGVQLDGRTQSEESYRYGFQNQEKDDEIKGAGNSLNYEFRMHDPRVGRFFAIDPLAREYPWNSSYSFSENFVTYKIEFKGLQSTDPPKQTNVLIQVVTADKIRELQLSGGFTEKMGTFQIFYVSDMVDANKKVENWMQKTGLSSLDNLVIRDHGATGGALPVLTNDGLYVGPQDFDTYICNVENDPSYNQLPDKQFDQIKAMDQLFDKVTDKGQIVVTGCQLGRGIMGRYLMETFQDMDEGRHDIYLNQDLSTAFDPPTNPSNNLTTSPNYEKGWIKGPAGFGDIEELKNEKNGKSGNLKIDSRSKARKKPIKEL